MSGHDQQLISAEAWVGGAERGAVAVVTGGESAEAIAALEASGHRPLEVDSIDELEGESLALVILCAAATVAEAVATQVPRLRELPAEPPVVIVCVEVRPGEIRSALAARVAGIVVAGQVDSHLLPCLEAVRSGQVCVPRAQARQVEPARLSPREKQILGLVVMGYMNGQIGERLFVAESTVKSHLSSAFAKLGVSSRTEAVELILDPERGLGTGILALGSEPLETTPTR